MKTLDFRIPLLTVLFAGAIWSSSAQEKSHQVTVKITREINGESKTFEKTYESEEAMKSDETLKQFVGEDSKMSFFGDERDDYFAWNHDSLSNHFQFHLEGDSMPHFQFFQGDDAFAQSFGFDMGDLEERMKVFHLKIAENMKDLHHGQSFAFSFPDDSTFNIHSDDSAFQKMNKHFEFITREDEAAGTAYSHILVSSDVSDFGKKAEVKKGNELKLTDLRFETGRWLKVKFNAPASGDLTMKLYNKQNKEVYSRYFEKHEGAFSEAIDMSQQKPDSYLLEITQNGNRLTRKITID